MAGVQADFLRGVTHDLQTPLTSIGALATELGANAAVPESARADLDTITHQADRLRRMVSQLLVASRLEAGVFTPQSDVFAVPPVIERTWAALRADRPFELTVTGAPHLAVADPDRLEQVLWAVLDNAVKYSPPASPIAASVDASHPGELAITIADRGPGMDDQTRQRAFDQFYRSEHARRMAPDGSGVGLYAARGLMEAMGGSIQVAGELGAGTAVTLRIPAEPSEGE
jgi:signal transduction histidine kinase